MSIAPASVPSPRSGFGRQTNRVDSLTGLRVFAAIIVVLYHRGLFALWQLSPGAARPAEIGFSSVGFFYVLSGFVLTIAYYGREIDRKAFYISRAARIYPLYLIALVLSLPGFAFKWHSGEILFFEGVGAAVLSPLVLQSWIPFTALKWNGPGWSLSCEAFFYLIFPFVLPRVIEFSKKRLMVGTVALWILALLPPLIYTLTRGVHLLPPIEPVQAAQKALLPTDNVSDIIAFNPLLRAPEFIAGIFLGLYALQSGKGQSVKARFGGTLLGSLAFTGLVAVLLLAPRIPTLFLHNGLLLPVWLLLILSMYRGGFFANALSLAPLVFLGEASYAIYILQSPVSGYLGIALRPILHLSFVGQYPTLLSLAIYIVVLVTISCVSFVFVERPARDWINGWWKRIRNSAKGA